MHRAGGTLELNIAEALLSFLTLDPSPPPLYSTGGNNGAAEPKTPTPLTLNPYTLNTEHQKELRARGGARAQAEHCRGVQRTPHPDHQTWSVGYGVSRSDPKARACTGRGVQTLTPHPRAPNSNPKSLNLIPKTPVLKSQLRSHVHGAGGTLKMNIAEAFDAPPTPTGG